MSTFRFDDIEMDLGRYHLTRGGAPVQVQPQVFDVLRYLIENRDRIVSKDELLEAVWEGRIVSESALTSRIKTARQMIGDDGTAQDRIRTLRGRGYQFIGQVEVREGVTSNRSGVDPRPTTFEARSSIAVLPFENKGAESDTDIFGEALAADIIGLLGLQRWLTVISHGTTLGYQRSPKSPLEVGRELSVRYVLAGYVQRRGDRVRVVAELSDCLKGTYLWGAKYDRQLSDLFQLQDEMAIAIAAEIEPEIGIIERNEIKSRPPESLDAWECAQRGFWHLFQFKPAELHEACSWLRKAEQIEPSLSRAQAGLCHAHVQLAFYDEPDQRREVIRQAIDYGRRAVTLDPRDSMGHCALGRALGLVGEVEEARAEIEEALRLSPSTAQSHFALAFLLTHWGDPEAALAHFERAERLSPHDPHIWTFFHNHGLALYRLKRFSEAETEFRKAILQPNAAYWPYASLASLLGTQGRAAEARPVVSRLMAMKPHYSCTFAAQDFFFASSDEFIEEFVAGLQTAGVPN